MRRDASEGSSRKDGVCAIPDGTSSPKAKPVHLHHLHPIQWLCLPMACDRHMAAPVSPYDATARHIDGTPEARSLTSSLPSLRAAPEEQGCPTISLDVERVVDFAWTSRPAMAHRCEPGGASHLTSFHLTCWLGGVPLAVDMPRTMNRGFVPALIAVRHMAVAAGFDDFTHALAARRLTYTDGRLGRDASSPSC